MSCEVNIWVLFISQSHIKQVATTSLSQTTQTQRSTFEKNWSCMWKQVGESGRAGLPESSPEIYGLCHQCTASVPPVYHQCTASAVYHHQADPHHHRAAQGPCLTFKSRWVGEPDYIVAIRVLKELDCFLSWGDQCVVYYLLQGSQVSALQLSVRYDGDL